MKPYYERGGVRLYHGDCREVLPYVDGHIVTDPPYGTGGWRRQAAGAGSNPSGSLVREVWDEGAVDWLGLMSVDVAAVFWPPARTRSLLEAADECGLTKHRALYWRKPDPKPMPGGRTRWSVEPIWVLSKEGVVLLGGDDVVDDVFEQSALRAGQPDAVGHPYQKPLRVMGWLVSKLPPGPIVDAFAGSGSTLVAAARQDRECVGIEQDERYCELAARRLDAALSQLNLFAA